LVVDWDLRADMRLFRKFCNASPASVVDEVVLDPDAADVVLPVAPVLDVDEAATPSDDNAPSMAATRPPSGGGVEDEAATDDPPEALDVLDALDCCANSAARLVRELV
jgi:hypothetical protein